MSATNQTCWHPKLGEHGEQLRIKTPTLPTSPETWDAPDAQATFVPVGSAPEAINHIRLRAESLDEATLRRLAKANRFSEPEFDCPVGLKAAAGAVVVEPDGRVWLTHPTNQFAGYVRTFPKGTAESASHLRETAVRETFEETGLLAELVGHLIDLKRSLSYTRFYLARRVGGRRWRWGGRPRRCPWHPLRP